MDEKCSDFQSAVDDYLIRHRSILDIMTKYQEASARVNRAFAKTVTECGCVTVNATRQQAPADIEYSNLKQFMSSHLSGEPCEQCKEVLTKELGHSLFYLAALCNLSGISLNEVMRRECDMVTTLGFFHLS
jgi:NTP pyrophosphatase (non-canonical NTP hydrolase)